MAPNLKSILKNTVPEEKSLDAIDIHPGTNDRSNQNSLQNDLELVEANISLDHPNKSRAGRAAESKNVEQNNLATIIQSPSEFSIGRLQGAVQDAGRYAFGIQGISVWIFDAEFDRLYAPPGGFWHHPDNIEPSDTLQLLVDESRSEHAPVVPVAPGTDIAGLLWLESNDREDFMATFMQRAASLRQITRVTSLRHLNRQPSTPMLAMKKQKSKKKLTWRCLQSMLEDPDTAKGPRMVLLKRAGFGLATAVPFQTELCSGMVVFLAKKTTDKRVLNSSANVTYLRESARFIGAAAAMTEARRAILDRQLGKKSYSIDEDFEEEEESPDLESRPVEVSEVEVESPHRVQVWLSKIRGGGLQIPPSLSIRQSFWTAFGAFLSLLMLSSLNEYYQILSDDEYFLLIGPFGALMTLQYGLTAAPASQPRNAIMGQAVAGAISLAFTYIPETILAVWLRRAVGPAVAIATMVKLGVTHPPAGAHAVLYASGDFNFGFYALVVLSTVLSVIPATLVNNLSRKRQYPTYWGFAGFQEWFKTRESGIDENPKAP